MSTPQKLLEDIATVVRKSASDADFRALALEDPHAAIRRVGGELPEGARIRFTDQEEEELIIALPPLQAGKREITADELDKITGGHVCWTQLNIIVDRNEHGEKMTREEVAKQQRDSLPAPIRSVFDKIASWF